MKRIEVQYVPDGTDGGWIYTGVPGDSLGAFFSRSELRTVLPDGYLNLRTTFVLRRLRRPEWRAFAVEGSIDGANIWLNHECSWVCRAALKALGIRLKRGEVRWYRLEVPS